MPFIYNVLIIASIVKKESALTSHILKQRKNLNFPVRNEKKKQNLIEISITKFTNVNDIFTCSRIISYMKSKTGNIYKRKKIIEEYIKLSVILLKLCLLLIIPFYFIHEKKCVSIVKKMSSHCPLNLLIAHLLPDIVKESHIVFFFSGCQKIE